MKLEKYKLFVANATALILIILGMIGIYFFIIRSYNDEAGDGSYHFGIAGREAYQVFCKMDTSKAESYTNKYLPTIGASSWGQAVPGYSLSRIKTNK